MKRVKLGEQSGLEARQWVCRNRILDVTEPLVMGIVNVTPDSFSDGGQHATHQEAITWALQMAADGAQILDVGGESTRPGALEVSEDEEIDRVVPVVERLVSEGLFVSVDTSKAGVMRESLNAGAQIINDIRAFTEPGAMQAVAGSGAGLVLMHMHGTPRTMQSMPFFEGDIVSEVERFLKEREAVLFEHGVRAESICWDPGFGFGKSVEQNLEVLANIGRFCDSGRVILMGLSRKSTVGTVTNTPRPTDRLAGSLAGSLWAASSGAQILRVHDVAQTVQALAFWRATAACYARASS